MCHHAKNTLYELFFLLFPPTKRAADTSGQTQPRNSFEKKAGEKNKVEKIAKSHLNTDKFHQFVFLPTISEGSFGMHTHARVAICKRKSCMLKQKGLGDDLSGKFRRYRANCRRRDKSCSQLESSGGEMALFYRSTEKSPPSLTSERIWKTHVGIARGRFCLLVKLVSGMIKAENAIKFNRHWNGTYVQCTVR